MLHKLLDHSPDLQALINEGYELEIRGAYALIHHIPYVDSNRTIKFGVLVSSLNIHNSSTIKPDTHVIYFIGNFPCDKEGNPLTPLQHSSKKEKLGNEIEVDFSFSNKPQNGYNDYYEKFVQYIRIITSPAVSLNPNVTAQTYICHKESVKSVFKYQDTNSSRARIGAVTEKLRHQKIGIIGLGGTGSYILDFVTKCPVECIHLYDGDAFLQHNAFRAPGATSAEMLNNTLKKVDYFKSVYSNMHTAIIAHEEYITEENINELNSLSFVFICVDQGNAKKVIIEHLLEKRIPFVDVGLDVNLVVNELLGQVRSTLVSEDAKEGLNHINLSPEEDNEDAYRSNIQIAELNALNACMAVIQWKKFSGFYQDLRKHCIEVYSINDGELMHEAV